MGGFLNALRALGAGRIIALGLVAALLVGFFSFLSMRLTTSPMAVLYANLELVDAGEITERLRALNVPYQMADNGGTVLVPSDQVLDLRMQFAGAGLGGTVGYELLDRQDALGSTSFLQNVNHRRALEGELARTIKTINIIQDARVHLVLPERELFSRIEREPSAAVTIRTKGGKLADSQVQAIRQLIAASVPQLDPGRISIIDHTGALLARIESSDEFSKGGQLHERRNAIETRLRNEIESLVEQVVGRGRVRAQVAAEIDFERISEESEALDPDGQVVVSSNTVERSGSNTEREGGVTTVANNLPDAQAGDAPPSQASSETETSEQINYENSRTRTTRIKESGAIERLSVAVVIDGNYTTAEDETTSYTPRTAEEIEQITRLVKNAVGFDEARGDSVEVSNLRFAEPLDLGNAAPEEGGLFSDLPVKDLQRVAEIFVLGFVAVLVLLMVVRPILKRVLDAIPDAKQASEQMAQLSGEDRPRLAPPDPSSLAAELAARAAEGDEEALEEFNRMRAGNTGGGMSIEAEIDVAQIEGKLKSSALKKVGDIVNRHPDESAAIVRQWLYAQN